MNKLIILLTFVGGSELTAFAQSKSDAILGGWLSSRKDSRGLIYRRANTYYGKLS